MGFNKALVLLVLFYQHSNIHTQPSRASLCTATALQLQTPHPARGAYPGVPPFSPDHRDGICVLHRTDLPPLPSPSSHEHYFPCPPHWANPTYQGRQASSTSSYSTSLSWPPQASHHFLLSAQGCEGCPTVGASPPSSALTHWTHSRWAVDERPRE